jgi:HEAT repeat protein
MKIALVLLMASVAFAQQEQFFLLPSAPFPAPPPSEGNTVFDTPLEDHHIELTKDALLAALRHPGPGVRPAAAGVLAAQWKNDALPAILEALAATTYPGDRIGLAYVAATLNSEEGVRALVGMCGDRSWDPGLRMVAAQTLSFRGREDCLPNVIDVLRTDDDMSATWTALNLLTLYSNVPAREMQQIRQLVRVLLRNDNVATRISVGPVLRKWGDAEAMEDLRSALAVEPDENVRGSLAAALKAIEQRLDFLAH